MKSWIVVILCMFFCKTFSLKLSPTYLVKWDVEADRITFHIEAEATGWIGLGFNNWGTMNKADMVIAGIYQGDKYIYDMHSDGYSIPKPDKVADYELLKAAENATHTSLTIRRALDTSDSDDYTISAEPLYLLWAYHSKADAIDPRDFPKHSMKGYQQLLLSNAARLR